MTEQSITLYARFSDGIRKGFVDDRLRELAKEVTKIVEDAEEKIRDMEGVETDLQIRRIVND